MHIIDKKLQQRAHDDNPIKIGIVGAGEMGKGLINQIHRYMPGMKVVAVYNRAQEKSEMAMKVAGIDKFKNCDTPRDIDKSIQQGQVALTSNDDSLCQANDIDVIVELTGQIEFGYDVTIKAFTSGKHVVSFNAELESTFGPLIKQKARDYGVKYTLGDGDQPGVTLNLYRYVKSMGFTPLVCGNIKGMQDRYRTPATQAAFAANWGINPVMATNFADGTKIAFEQACIANATNMVVSERGMRGYPYDGHIDDLTDKFDIEELKSLGGVVDYALGSKPGPGVFVFASANDPLSEKYLSYCKLGKGPLYSFYVPYHLLFFELAFSIPRLVDFDDVTLNAAYGMKVEVNTFAKHDLEPGTKLDGIGGFHTYGMCENFTVSRKEHLVPMGLSEHTVVKHSIPKDAPITFDDIEYDKESSVFKWYREQVNMLKRRFLVLMESKNLL